MIPLRGAGAKALAPHFWVFFAYPAFAAHSIAWEGGLDMQPILLVRAARPGAIYLNGRFAGEVEEERETALPIAAQGAQILQFFPYDDSLPMARRLVFARGKPVVSAWNGLAGIRAVVWPCGALELELEPAGTSKDSAHARRVGEMDVLEEKTDAGERLTLSRAGQVLLRVEGREATLRADGSVYALSDLGDEVGHARAAVYTPTAEGYSLATSDMLWAQGGPAWPQTPEACALAALQAQLLGLSGEADGYLAAGYACASAPLSEIVEGFDACVRMKFPLPSGESAVALLRLAGDNLLEAVPVLYSVSPTGGAQGPYRLEHLRREETAPLP